MLNLPQDKKIILFDGVCNLCNSAVNYVIAHDKKDVFRFVAIQSDLGQKIINHIGVDTTKTDSIILYIPQKAYYYKSQAALKIACDLSDFLPLLALFQIIPTSISNWVYDYVAKNRYRWYGKKESCMIPTPELKSKFLA
ncbi:thiol-disulfide oxidoreductase DCC family protein [Flavobacterium faecale]|uniref:thiol-disulfide oxidoreductase DCC family protein n=1 Tax=Flavobacterium faecale TaxID=1355330 RepID=UPI003AAF6544